MAIIRGAEPFLLRGGEKGVLLVHGFTGSPAEMRLLGEFLQKQGYTVLGVRLDGHGTTPQDLAQTNWTNWYGSVENGYHILQGICKDVAVIGLSMGGLLAIQLAAEYPLSKLVSLSAPIHIYDRRIAVVPLAKYFRTFVAKKRRQYDVNPIYAVGYDKMPLSGLHSMVKMIQHVQSILPQINIPVLIIQSRKEHTVKPESAEFIYRHIGSNNKKLIWLERSGHIITLDIEKEFVFACISNFLGED